MKRFHVHVAVNDMTKSIAFYSAMFGERPTVTKPDYAKWMLDEPRVNFAISNRGQAPGINHLGMQAEDDAELEAIHANLQNADTTVVPEKGAHCCYAVSDKYWVTDPQGIAWESFRSLESIPLYGENRAVTESTQATTSCGGGESATSSCCGPRQATSLSSEKTATGCCQTA
jgi:catechol 2,3-dioxygenase-like lactoylglutathione lyase family enzyme